MQKKKKKKKNRNGVQKSGREEKSNCVLNVYRINTISWKGLDDLSIVYFEIGSVVCIVILFGDSFIMEHWVSWGPRGRNCCNCLNKRFKSSLKPAVNWTADDSGGWWGFSENFKPLTRHWIKNRWQKHQIFNDKYLLTHTVTPQHVIFDKLKHVI